MHLYNMFDYATSAIGCKGIYAHQLFVPQINTTVEPQHGMLCLQPCTTSLHLLTLSNVNFST